MRGLSRYALVGLVATAAHYALLVCLVEWVAAPPGPAAFMGAVLGAGVAYLGNRRYTFSNTDMPHGQTAPRFAAIAGVGAVGNAGVVAGGVALGLHYLLAQVLATAVVMLATYHLNRVWTFGPPPP
ncbi:MAG: GtrA family protein [Betaproteobacteria bacterium]